MPRTFKCPSCGGPLEFAGSITQFCKFCGGNVIPPKEMFVPDPSPRDAERGPALSQHPIEPEIHRLLLRGNKIAAIKEYRDAFQTGLKESLEAMDALERGETVSIDGFTLSPPTGPDGKPLSASRMPRSTGPAFIITAIAVIIAIGLVILGAAVAFLAD